MPNTDEDTDTDANDDDAGGGCPSTVAIAAKTMLTKLKQEEVLGSVGRLPLNDELGLCTDGPAPLSSMVCGIHPSVSKTLPVATPKQNDLVCGAII